MGIFWVGDGGTATHEEGVLIQGWLPEQYLAALLAFELGAWATTNNVGMVEDCIVQCEDSILCELDQFPNYKERGMSFG